MGVSMLVRLFLLCLLALAVSSAFAQAVPATAPIPRVAFPISTVGNVATFGMKTADAANAANFSFGVAANGSIFASAPDRLPTPGGGSIPVTVGGSIPKTSVAAALGRFARKALPVLSTGVALYDLGQELGFGLDNSSGSLLLTVPDPTLCASNCYTFTGKAGTISVSSKSISGFASAYVSAANTYGNPIWIVTGVNEATYSFTARRNYSSGYVDNLTITPTKTARPPDPPANIPSTLDDFVNAVAARDGWSSSSALARATVDAIKSGESLDVVPDAAAGPATSPGPTATTVNDTAGQTTVSTTTNHHTYQGASVTTNVITTNVTTDNSTGAVVNSTTVNSSPVLETPPSSDPLPVEFPCGGPGLPACSVKVDETSTPATVTMADPFPQIQQDHADKLGAIKAADGAAWEMVRDFFFLPPSTACVPFDMPVVMGIQVPDVNPCPVVSGIQQVTAVLWAIGAFWIMLGWVREVL